MTTTLPTVLNQITPEDNDEAIKEMAQHLTAQDWAEFFNSPSSSSFFITHLRKNPKQVVKLAFWSNGGNVLSQELLRHRNGIQEHIYQLPLTIFYDFWENIDPAKISEETIGNTLCFLGWDGRRDENHRNGYVETEEGTFEGKVALWRLINKKAKTLCEDEKKGTNIRNILTIGFERMLKDSFWEFNRRNTKSILSSFKDNDDFVRAKKLTSLGPYANEFADALLRARLHDPATFLELTKAISDFVGVDEELLQQKYMRTARKGWGQDYMFTALEFDYTLGLVEAKPSLFKQSDFKKIIAYYTQRHYDIKSESFLKLKSVWDRIEPEQQKAFAKSMAQQAPHVLEKMVDFVDEKVIVGAWADFFQSRLDKTPKCQRLWEKHIMLEKVQDQMEAKSSASKRKM